MNTIMVKVQNEDADECEIYILYIQLQSITDNTPKYDIRIIVLNVWKF